MCARPERTEYYRPINDLLHEFVQYATPAGSPTMRELAWVGVVAYNGLLENA